MTIKERIETLGSEDMDVLCTSESDCEYLTTADLKALAESHTNLLLLMPFVRFDQMIRETEQKARELVEDAAKF